MTAISAIVIARNETANIADCLDTLAWADERLVVDAFSTDGTTDAALPDVRVVERRWSDFADQRDAALRLAVHDWVLFVDADERVPPDLRREIRQMMGEGAGRSEVVEFLVARYGEFVLYRPRFQPSTWALWGGPAFFVILGMVVFARILRARMAQPLEGEEPP